MFHGVFFWIWISFLESLKSALQSFSLSKQSTIGQFVSSDNEKKLEASTVVLDLDE
tara:strand:- start:336 stop:503 length:168 start_codon:yes stop_codon:yes gene_type:complete